MRLHPQALGIVLGLVIAGASAPAAQAVPDDRTGTVQVAKAAAPAVAVSSTTLRRGETFAVAGKDFRAGVSYRIYLGARRTTTGKVFAQGTVFRTVAFPASARTGRQPVTIAAYRNGQRFQKATVFVSVVR